MAIASPVAQVGGVVIGWQFVGGEYVGGVLLIMLMWLAVRLTRPRRLIDAARECARQSGGRTTDDDGRGWRALPLLHAI